MAHTVCMGSSSSTMVTSIEPIPASSRLAGDELVIMNYGEYKIKLYRCAS